MTLAQIEKTRDFLQEVDQIEDFQSMEIFTGELDAFYNDDFSLYLKIYTWNTADSYENSYLEKDKAMIKSFLESLIAKDDNYSQVCEILDLIAEGESLVNNIPQRKKFISKVFHAYSGRIIFDKAIESIVSTPNDFFGIGSTVDTEGMVPGIICKLRDYVRDICTPKQSEVCVQPLVQVNNTAMSNASAYIQIDISTLIVQAYRKAEDEGLPDAQLKEIQEKLSEIEEVAKSNESKGKRWQKAKEILKWVAEQGIQVAAILMPVLAQTIR